MNLQKTIVAGVIACCVGVGAAEAAVYWTPAESSRTTHGFFSTGSFPTADSLSNLTTLGPSDWVTWAWDSNAVVEANSKSGGSGIGAVTVNKTTGQLTASSTRAANSVFDFTNGTSPTSGSNVDAAAGLTRGDSPVPLPVMSFTVPLNADGSENTVVVWFSAAKVNNGGLRIRAFDGVTQVGSSLNPVVTTGDNVNKYVYTIDFGGADTARDLTLEFALTSSSQPDGHLVLHGAALEVVPEPASLAVIAMAGGTLLRRRRRA